jgi:hypothetical protein
MAYIVSLSFLINYIVSCLSLYSNNLGYQTAVVLMTNTLFMLTKVYHVFYVGNTDRHVFYSAYLRDRIQFNDISPQIRMEVVALEKEEEQVVPVMLDDFCTF